MRISCCLLVVAFAALISACSNKVTPTLESSKAVVLEQAKEPSFEETVANLPKIGESRNEIIKRCGEPDSEFSPDNNPSPMTGWRNINGFKILIMWHGNKVGRIRYHILDDKLSSEQTHQLMNANGACLFTSDKLNGSSWWTQSLSHDSTAHLWGDAIIMMQTMEFFQIRARHGMSLHELRKNTGSYRLSPLNKTTQKFVPADDAKHNSKKKNGLMTRLYSNGKKQYEANYKDGEQHGLEIFWYPNGQKLFEAKYEKGKRQGLAILRHHDGHKYIEINYEGGKRHGLVTRWHSGGEKAYKVNIDYGKLHGLETSWYEDGQKSRESHYKNGQKQGLSVMWYENGQKSKETNYEDDEMVTVTVWQPNGTKCSETNFENGKGVLVEYHENGQKSVETNYVDGKKHGLQTHWDEEGNVTEQAKFENGEKVE